MLQDTSQAAEKRFPAIILSIDNLSAAHDGQKLDSWGAHNLNQIFLFLDKNAYPFADLGIAGRIIRTNYRS
ncbi:MAG: hypothetical protein ABSC21_09420 [Terriglobia bacterium]|jgi:hypothetical protein